MASPHLAGTVALLLDAGVTDTGAPGLFDDVRAKLCTTANLATGLQGIFGNTPIPPSDPRYATYLRLRRARRGSGGPGLRTAAPAERAAGRGR